jgi:hypothetical protein
MCPKFFTYFIKIHQISSKLIRKLWCFSKLSTGPIFVASQANMEREIQERSAKIQEVREAGPARNGSADGCSLDVCAYGIQVFKNQRYDMV